MSSKPHEGPLADIGKELVKCKYCNQEVQLSVLPFHEYCCQQSKTTSKTW